MRHAPEFALIAISRGSAVLHLEPLESEEAPPEDGVDIVVDPVDGLLEMITRLHHAAESGGDLRAFGDNRHLLHGLRELTGTLDRHNLVLQMTWRAGNGRYRSSHLTTEGRRHIRAIWGSQPQSVMTSVTGRVVGLTLTSFTLKPMRGKKIEVHVEGEDGVVSLDLPLGQNVSVLVEEISEVNTLGITTHTRLVFRERVHQPTL
jgi:hypothetical protein